MQPLLHEQLITVTALMGTRVPVRQRTDALAVTAIMDLTAAALADQRRQP
jgi:hypothetical protein